MSMEAHTIGNPFGDYARAGWPPLCADRNGHAVLGLRVWAITIYLMTTGLKGVGSMKLHSDLDITKSRPGTWPTGCVRSWPTPASRSWAGRDRQDLNLSG